MRIVMFVHPHKVVGVMYCGVCASCRKVGW